MYGYEYWRECHYAIREGGAEQHDAAEVVGDWGSRGGQENGEGEGRGASETEPAAHSREDFDIVKQGKEKAAEVCGAKA